MNLMVPGSPALWLNLATAVLFGTLSLAAVVWLRRKRQKGLVYLVFFTVFAVYLYGVLSYTLLQYQSLVVLKAFLPGLKLNGQGAGHSLNLVPLVSLTADDVGTSLLNVLMLVPFGFGFPFLANRRLARVTVTAAAFSGLIEVSQFLSGLAAGTAFRVADINDVLFNTLGAAIGYGLFLGFLRLVSLAKPRLKDARNPFLRYVFDLEARHLSS